MKNTRNKILVVVAHADDEVIGCGGTLLKHRDAGDEIQIIYMTDGVGARNESNTNTATAKNSEKEIRLTSQINACEQLAMSKFHNFDFPDNRMDQVALIDVTQAIESVINNYPANIIYTHHGGDLNVDHRIVHQAVMTACRPQPMCSIEKILAFEVNSSTEWPSASMSTPFYANYFVDISNYQAEKQLLLQHYRQEIKPSPHSRSLQAIAHLNHARGNHVGIESAEAFTLIRQIVS
ncbi:MAG: PIG-L family deacetylase [Alteromonadaceae bacterium]|nr:PIG-L family deacetylase [Alteromonadaceae bacterium]